MSAAPAFEKLLTATTPDGDFDFLWRLNLLSAWTTEHFRVCLWMRFAMLASSSRIDNPAANCSDSSRPEVAVLYSDLLRQQPEPPHRFGDVGRRDRDGRALCVSVPKRLYSFMSDFASNAALFHSSC